MKLIPKFVILFLSVSSNYNSKMNILKTYRQDVGYGPLPFVLNNLGNLQPVKQSRHKLPLLPSPTYSF